MRFTLEESIDMARGQLFCIKHNLPMATILTTGLMRGFYVYSLDSERAFRYADPERQSRPLRRYGQAMAFDLALSYSSEDRDAVALPLASRLEELGVTTYLLDVAEDPDDPLWGLRYREAVFHSRYFAPILGPGYLAREGTAAELFDLARMTVEHRKDEFFYPLIPLVPSVDDLSQRVFADRGALARELDPRGFEWLRTHVFFLSIERGVAELARFFGSLARNAGGQLDTTYLECLADQMEWLELYTFSGSRRMARMLFKNPILTYYIFDAHETGVTRYTGLGEPQENAVPARELADPVRAILDHLGLTK